MTTKVLFFDTSALLKIFINEDGAENVKWLTSRNTKSLFALHFVINEQVCNEFESNIRRFSETKKITNEKAEKILLQFSTHCKGKYFRIIGQDIISNTKSETTLSSVVTDLCLKPGKNDWDAIIFQSIINALAYLGGKSHPILVTCDVSLAKKVARKGYRVINPQKQNLNEIKSVIA